MAAQSGLVTCRPGSRARKQGWHWSFGRHGDDGKLAGSVSSNSPQFTESTLVSPNSLVLVSSQNSAPWRREAAETLGRGERRRHPCLSGPRPEHLELPRMGPGPRRFSHLLFSQPDPPQLRFGGQAMQTEERFLEYPVLSSLLHGSSAGGRPA